MTTDLGPATGLPVRLDHETGDLTLGPGVNRPSWTLRKLHDLDRVWAHPTQEPDRVMYRYTSGLWRQEDEKRWKEAGVVYGIVVFLPGAVGGEYPKSSGQYHPICPPNTQATPEIYTVVSGVGHFLLQRAVPPYGLVDDAVLVEVRQGETFVVPPDYGHLQINPGDDVLAFSYTVMDGMKGVYAPFAERQGAIYYEMEGNLGRFVFNQHYPDRIPLRFLRAADLRQIPSLRGGAGYDHILEQLSRLQFLTDPTQFPDTAAL